MQNFFGWNIIFCWCCVTILRQSCSPISWTFSSSSSVITSPIYTSSTTTSTTQTQYIEFSGNKIVCEGEICWPSQSQLWELLQILRATKENWLKLSFITAQRISNGLLFILMRGEDWWYMRPVLQCWSESQVMTRGRVNTAHHRTLSTLSISPPAPSQPTSL